MHDDTIPLEAGIESRGISFDKGCYVGQEVVIRILHRGGGRVARRLVWVEHAPHAQDGPVWRAGERVHLADKVVGHVTSACWSPARGGLLGIAMLHRDATEPGTLVRIGADDAGPETSLMRAIVVSAAVIERDDAFLLTRRAADAHLGGRWEFPGGKVERARRSMPRWSARFARNSAATSKWGRSC